MFAEQANSLYVLYQGENWCFVFLWKYIDGSGWVYWYQQWKDTSKTPRIISLQLLNNIWEVYWGTSEFALIEVDLEWNKMDQNVD